MILTNKENNESLVLNSRDVLKVIENARFTKVLMKDGTLYIVHEKKLCIRTLMVVELIIEIKGLKNEKI